MDKETLIYGRWWSYANGQWNDPFTGFRSEDKNEFANYIADKYGRKEAEYFLRNIKQFMSNNWHFLYPFYLKLAYLNAESSEDKVPTESK
jgi:hypothetical protein